MSTKKKKKAKGKDDSTSSTISDLDGYDSITVAPGRTPQKQGNLTGTARKVKDTCADWHNYVVKWDSLNSDGANVISQIANVKIAADTGDDERPANDLPPELNPLCEKLLIFLEALGKVLRKMEKMTQDLKGVMDLETYQTSGIIDTVPLFQTWPINKYYETSLQLFEIYKEEYRLKKCIAENIAHTNDRKQLMFLNSAWLHQPYTDQRTAILIEGLLRESGHR